MGSKRPLETSQNETITQQHGARILMSGILQRAGLAPRGVGGGPARIPGPRGEPEAGRWYTRMG